MAEQVARSIRAGQEVFDKIKKITTEMGFQNQGEALSAILNAWESNKAKETCPGLKDVITELQGHQNAISRIFNFVIESSLEQESVIQESFAAEMQTLREEVKKANERLKEEKNLRHNLLDENQTLKETIEELKHQLLECENLNKDLRQALNTVTALKGGN